MALGFEVGLHIGMGGLQYALALLLLVLRFLDRSNRALAMILVFRGTYQIAWAVADWTAKDAPWGFIGFHFFMAYFVAIAYFVSVYPRPRRWLPRSPWGVFPFLASMALLSALFALRVGPADEQGYPVWASAFGAIAELIFPVAVLVWLRDAGAMPAGPRRTSVLIVATAFTLIDLYDNASFVLVHLVLGQNLAGGGLWVTYVNVALFCVVAAFAARALAASPDHALRRGLRRFLSAFALATLSAAFVVLVVASNERDVAVDEGGLGAGVAAVWDLALPLLLAYALVRHQLFDIDIKVKRTIQQSTIAATFVAVFFVVSETAQKVFAEDLAWGPYLGIVGAGLLLFALSPLQRLAERVANAAMPGVRAPEDLSSDERRRLYREQVVTAWADGAMSRDERRLLDALRQHLGLDEAEAGRLEREALAVAEH